MEELTGIIAILACAVIVLSPMIVWLIAIIKKAANQQYQMQKQSELLAQVVEKGSVDNLNLDAIAAAFNQQKSIKQSLLKNLRGGVITALLGLAMVALGIVGSIDKDAYTLLDASTFYVAGAILLSCGVALTVYYFFAKKSLRAEIEQEEKNALKDKQ